MSMQRARMASACEASPLAISSITRSMMDCAKVTPQALTACRSNGASICGFPISPRWATLFSANASTLPSDTPSRPRTKAAGSSISSRSRIVGASLLVMSRIAPSLTQTRLGPATSGFQTRPTRLAAAWSSGRMFCSDVSMAGPSCRPVTGSGRWLTDNVRRRAIATPDRYQTKGTRPKNQPLSQMARDGGANADST